MWQFYTKTLSSPKGISLFYTPFQNKLNFTHSLPYQKWESYLDKTFTPTQWQCTFITIYKASRCVNHWEGTFSKNISEMVPHTVLNGKILSLQLPIVLERMWCCGHANILPVFRGAYLDVSHASQDS